MLVGRFFVAEDFRGESLDGCAALPGIERQSRFAGGLFEERRAVPVVFDRHLRQEQPAVASHSDEQAVAANFDGIGGNRLGRRENAEFDLQLERFFRCDGMKAGVVEGRGPRGFRHSSVNGAHGKDVAHASPQLASQIKRSERSARFGKMGSRRGE